MKPTLAQKLELARAAVELAEANLATQKIGKFTVYPWSYSGPVDSVSSEFEIGRRAMAGEDMSSFVAECRRNDSDHQKAKLASDRMGARRDVARERYLAARKACGFPDVSR